MMVTVSSCIHQSSIYSSLSRCSSLPRKPRLRWRRPDFTKVEDEIQLAYVAEELIQHFYKEVDGFQIGQLVVVGIDTGTEEESGVATVDDLAAAAELDEVGLVLIFSSSLYGLYHLAKRVLPLKVDRPQSPQVKRLQNIDEIWTVGDVTIEANDHSSLRWVRHERRGS
ncbi:hypothetical protein KC345_g6 [Hortaea werneckii]|nr:hypothetical protein KC345_g6 [Hortaea werneckii]